VSFVIVTGGQRRQDLLAVGVPLLAFGGAGAVWTAVRVSFRLDAEGIEIRNGIARRRDATEGTVEDRGTAFFPSSSCPRRDDHRRVSAVLAFLKAR